MASTGVIWEGSTRGMGLHLSRAFETIPCHWGGSPTYLKEEYITFNILDYDQNKFLRIKLTFLHDDQIQYEHDVQNC